MAFFICRLFFLGPIVCACALCVCVCVPGNKVLLSLSPCSVQTHKRDRSYDIRKSNLTKTKGYGRKLTTPYKLDANVYDQTTKIYERRIIVWLMYFVIESNLLTIHLMITWLKSLGYCYNYWPFKFINKSIATFARELLE